MRIWLSDFFFCRGVQDGRAVAGEGAAAAARAEEAQLLHGVHPQGDGGGLRHVQRQEPHRQGWLRPGLQGRAQRWAGTFNFR